MRTPGSFDELMDVTDTLPRCISCDSLHVGRKVWLTEDADPKVYRLLSEVYRGKFKDSYCLECTKRDPGEENE
tara:strand:- start:2001 stop:2219 length:219 start_codon:yes stop_codon:yes gene_type:complete